MKELKEWRGLNQVYDLPGGKVEIVLPVSPQEKRKVSAISAIWQVEGEPKRI